MNSPYQRKPGGRTSTTVRERLLSYLLDHVGKTVTNEQLKEAARDPDSGVVPENWHQRLSELRTDYGYTILSRRDRRDLRQGEYRLESTERRSTAKLRKALDHKIKTDLLKKNSVCAYPGCNLREGGIDPIGGGTVRLQLDHKTAHDHDDMGDDNPDNYQLLCGRHNVVKKNLWDDQTGKLNTKAILQSLSEVEKRKALAWLIRYFEDK